MLAMGLLENSLISLNVTWIVLEGNNSDPVQYLRKRSSSFWSLYLMNRRRWFDTVVSDGDIDCGIVMDFATILAFGWRFPLILSRRSVVMVSPIVHRIGCTLLCRQCVAPSPHVQFLPVCSGDCFHLEAPSSCDCWVHWALHLYQHFGSLGVLHLRHPSLLG